MGAADVWVHLNPGDKRDSPGEGGSGAQNPTSGTLEEEELTEEPERSDRKGVITGQGHMVTEASAGALWQGSDRVASEGRCRKVYRFRENPIWWLQEAMR